MSNCIFCKIAEGKSPASVVFENSEVIAFMDIQPVTPGHTLIIPKQHIAYLAELDEATGIQLFSITKKIAHAVRNSGVKCEGINLFLADGEAAGQEVFHLHMHVIPRYKGDNFLVKAKYRTKPTGEDLNKIAHRIKSTYLS